MYRGRLRYKDDAGRELVQASHERRPLARGPASRVPEQRVHQRPARVRVRGVRHDAGRLVHGQEVIVLMKNVPGDLLDLHRSPRRLRGKRDGDHVASRGTRGDSTNCRAVHADMTRLDPVLDPCPCRHANPRKMFTEHEIDPPARVAPIGLEDHMQYLGLHVTALP